MGFDKRIFFATEIMLGIPNHGPNFAMTNRAVAFNDARLDRLEKAISSIGAKQTVAFVPTEDIAVIDTSASPKVVPTFVAKSPVRSINKIDSVKLYATGSDTLNTAISTQLGIEGLEVSSIAIRANLLPFNLTNTTTALSNGMSSNGFYFISSACGSGLDDVTSTYLGGTPISMLQANQFVWISEALANKLIANIDSAKSSGIITTANKPGTSVSGFQIKVGYTDSILENMLILCRVSGDESSDIDGVSSIVVEYE